MRIITLLLAMLLVGCTQTLVKTADQPTSEAGLAKENLTLPSQQNADVLKLAAYHRQLNTIFKETYAAGKNAFAVFTSKDVGRLKMYEVAKNTDQIYVDAVQNIPSPQSLKTGKLKRG